MSEFASYCTFVRNKHSKQAAWQDDLLSAAQANPELAGAAVGGLGGAATGLFSGHMLRNGLIGAGLGAGAGLGYRHRSDIADLWSGTKPELSGPPKPLEQTGPPSYLAGGKPNDMTNLLAQGKPEGPIKTLLKDTKTPSGDGFNPGPAPKLGPPEKVGPPSHLSGEPGDDLKTLNTKSPGNPLATLMGGKPVGEGDASTDAIESNLGQVPVQPTTRESGVAAAAKRNHVTAQANKLLAPFANSSNPKVQQVKALIEARMPAASPDAPSPEDLASAEGLLASVDNVKAMPGAAADAVGKKIDGAKQIAGEGWDKVKDIAGAPGRAASNWGKAREEEQKATATEQAQQNAALDQIIKLLQENQ